MQRRKSASTTWKPLEFWRWKKNPIVSDWCLKFDFHIFVLLFFRTHFVLLCLFLCIVSRVIRLLFVVCKYDIIKGLYHWVQFTFIDRVLKEKTIFSKSYLASTNSHYFFFQIGRKKLIRDSECSVPNSDMKTIK